MSNHGSNIQSGGINAIEASGLRKSFGRWPVLWNLDLSLAWGERLVILGANGAGKTTLLKLLSGRARPDAGRVRIAGFDIRTASTNVRRSMGVVCHRHLLYEDMTVVENLRFYGRMFGLGNTDVRIDEVLYHVGLEGRGHQRVSALSNGLQKRLGIGRAILHKPSILLLDEPESGLDYEALEMLTRIIGDWKSEKRSILMTTHNLDKGLEWGDRIAVLAKGKIDFNESRQHLDPASFKGAFRQELEVAP